MAAGAKSTFRFRVSHNMLLKHCYQRVRKLLRLRLCQHGCHDEWLTSCLSRQVKNASSSLWRQLWTKSCLLAAVTHACWHFSDWGRGQHARPDQPSPLLISETRSLIVMGLRDLQMQVNEPVRVNRSFGICSQQPLLVSDQHRAESFKINKFSYKRTLCKPLNTILNQLHRLPILKICFSSISFAVY